MIILVVFALLLVVLGFSVKNPRVLWGIALAGLLASLLVNLDLMGLSWSRAIGLTLWPVPGSGDSGLLADLRLNVGLFALFFNLVFLMVALLTIIASHSYLKKEEPHQAEYYGLLFLAVTGMMLVAAATDLFVLYLSFELSSLSTFALVAFRKRDKRATEASLKFFIIGAVSSALILFGISVLILIAGSLNPVGATTSLAGLRALLVTPALQASGMEAPFIIAVIFLLAGFGFKVATVPFHMWAPDVYEGSPTTISVFLAAGSKKVGVAAMFQVFLVALLAAQVDWQLALAGLAIATMTVGNVLAIPQRNIKRMLAYSSISHAGFLLIGVAAFKGDFGTPGLLIYLLAYTFTNLGAFFIAMLLEQRLGSLDIPDYAGLSQRSPALAALMALFMLSLTGIPPTAGFFGKFYIFGGAINNGLIWLAVVAIANSVVALYYYVNVIRVMYLLPASSREPVTGAAALQVALGITALGTLVIGIFPQPFINLVGAAALLLRP